MEHPIPQNVTSFEFKLVGDMTLKQFLYLCIGIGIAYLAFITSLSTYPLIAWPIIITSTILGAAFAFLPIADRPLDYWLIAYLKAVYSPTKRLWVKNNKNSAYYPQFKDRLNLYIHQISIKTAAATNPQPVSSQPTTIQTSMSQQPKVTETPIPTIPLPEPIENTQQQANLPSEEELSQTVELARQAQALQVQIIETERELSQIKSAPPASNIQTTIQVNQALENLQKLVGEASIIKQQLSKTTHQPQIPQPQVRVNVVPAPKPKINQLVLTTFPNVINGVITDAQNNYLESVVVVIYDKEGLPVRALKTNKLGQFSGATPLPNGIYTLQLEKDNLIFDVVQLELEGNVLPPILVAAKGG